MSSKKGVGSSKNGRDSESKRLGLKVGAGEYVIREIRQEEKESKRLQQGSIVSNAISAPTL